MTRPPTILFYNTFWPELPRSMADCPARCRLVFDQDLYPDADAVVFHLPTLKKLPTEKVPGQLWVVWSMESDAYYPIVPGSPMMKRFDVTMTYQQNSDIWTPYFDEAIAQDLMGPVQQKLASPLAVYFASNDRDFSGRRAYVRELMEYMVVDSYGRSLRNKVLDIDEGRRTKLEVISRYKFTLAFENSISRDYVTEKFFDPLIAGSVPVYLGAPNIDDFAPADRCFVDVTRFSGPKELAQHLESLGRDEARYVEYLAWKRDGLRDSFLGLLARRRLHPICRLCIRARAPRR